MLQGAGGAAWCIRVQEVQVAASRCCRCNLVY